MFLMIYANAKLFFISREEKKRNGAEAEVS